MWEITGAYKLEQIAALFSGWNETMIRSCLQGHMGRAAGTGEGPESARIEIGDFCFFAGNPSRELVCKAEPPILVPPSIEWSHVIEDALGKAAVRHTRYRVKKEPGVFCREYLASLVDRPSREYEIKLIDQPVAEALMSAEWSRDLCGQFDGGADFCRRGLGAAALHHGRPVAGASSYIIYDGGIEIEIDTMPEYRRRGLAAACGARLILECLDRGLYPSWDAHDLRSLALAEKLGYHTEGPYPVYIKKNEKMQKNT